MSGEEAPPLRVGRSEKRPLVVLVVPGCPDIERKTDLVTRTGWEPTSLLPGFCPRKCQQVLKLRGSGRSCGSPW